MRSNYRARIYQQILGALNKLHLVDSYQMPDG